MPRPVGSLTAVVVSGGKQYRVAPGDRVLVDRVAGEPGSEFEIGRVLMVADGDDFKLGSPALDGVSVAARVIEHKRGKKIDVLRYKSKKRVRVHKGARADLSLLEILTVGGKGPPKQVEKAVAKTIAETPAGEAEAAPESGADTRPATPKSRPARTALKPPAPKRAAPQAGKSDGA